jgi:hypothetical protein
MAYTKYSLTPANNTAAPPDGAPEGMLPSAVNDTMRDMMAQIRDCGDGIRDGTYTMTAPKITGGTITGSTINNSAIGGTTAAAGAFTTLSATGVTTVQAGTVSLPAITTTGDTNTGIFFPAADTIAFTEGGVESMRINSSGNVGIGNTSALVTAGGRGNLTINGSSSAILVFGVAGVSQGYIFNNGTDLTTFNDNVGAIIWENNGSERMRIDSSGNVGIGTSSPAQKLDIASKVQINTSNSYGRINIARATDSALALYIQGADNAGTVNDLSLVNSGGGGAAINITGGDLRFYATSNTTERMRITSDGDLLVGKTSATTNTVGVEMRAVGLLACTRASSNPLTVHRTVDDGDLVSFQQGGTQEGTISVSGTTVSYNAFAGSHWSQLSVAQSWNQLTSWLNGRASQSQSVYAE